MMSGNSLHYSAMMKLKLKTESVGRSARYKVTLTGSIKCEMFSVSCVCCYCGLAGVSDNLEAVHKGTLCVCMW